MTHVEVAQPLEDGSVVLLGLAQQGGLLILRLYQGQYFVILSLGTCALCVITVKAQSRFQASRGDCTYGDCGELAWTPHR